MSTAPAIPLPTHVEAENTKPGGKKNEQAKKANTVEKKGLFRRVDWNAESKRINAMSEAEVAQPENLRRAQKMIDAGVTEDINDALKQLKDIQLKEAQLRLKKVDENDPRFIELLQQEGRMQEAARRIEEFKKQAKLLETNSNTPEEPKAETIPEGAQSSIEAARNAAVTDFDVSGLLGDSEIQEDNSDDEVMTDEQMAAHIKQEEAMSEEEAADREQEAAAPYATAEAAELLGHSTDHLDDSYPIEEKTDPSQEQTSQVKQTSEPKQPESSVMIDPKSQAEIDAYEQTLRERRDDVEIQFELQKALPENLQFLLEDNSFHLIFENKAFLEIARDPKFKEVTKNYTGRFDNQGFPILQDGTKDKHRASEFLSNSAIRKVAQVTLNAYKNIYPERMTEPQPLPENMGGFTTEEQAEAENDKSTEDEETINAALTALNLKLQPQYHQVFTFAGDEQYDPETFQIINCVDGKIVVEVSNGTTDFFEKEKWDNEISLLCTKVDTPFSVIQQEQSRQKRQELLRRFDIKAVEHIDTKAQFTFGNAAPREFNPGEHYRIKDKNGKEATLIIIGHDQAANHLTTSDESQTTLSVWTPELFDKFFSGEETGMSLEKIPIGREEVFEELMNQADTAIKSENEDLLNSAKNTIDAFLYGENTPYPTTQEKKQLKKRERDIETIYKRKLSEVLDEIEEKLKAEIVKEKEKKQREQKRKRRKRKRKEAKNKIGTVQQNEKAQTDVDSTQTVPRQVGTIPRSRNPLFKKQPQPDLPSVMIDQGYQELIDKKVPFANPITPEKADTAANTIYP